jgi:hypothetical protein
LLHGQGSVLIRGKCSLDTFQGQVRMEWKPYHV